MRILLRRAPGCKMPILIPNLGLGTLAALGEPFGNN